MYETSWHFRLYPVRIFSCTGLHWKEPAAYVLPGSFSTLSYTFTIVGMTVGCASLLLAMMVVPSALASGPTYTAVQAKASVTGNMINTEMNKAKNGNKTLLIFIRSS